MKNTLFALVIISYSLNAQTYFFEDFNYENFQKMDSLFKNNSDRSIWATTHSVNNIDFNENGLIDNEENFKNTSIVEDPYDSLNKVIRFQLNKLDPYYYAKYSCDDATIDNVIQNDVLKKNRDSIKNLYCTNCTQSPLKIASYSYKTHMNRNEIAIYGTRRDLYKAKKEHWFGMKMLIDENYQFDINKTGEIVTQFHGKGRKIKNPPVALLIVNDRFRIVNIKNNDGKGESYDAGPVIKNQWIDWKYRLVFSKKDKHGLIEVWRDGEKIMSQSGKNFFKNYPVYLKIGVYKWGWWDCSKEINTTYKALYYDKVWANNYDITKE